MGLYEDFIFTRTYSRWIPELGRRETWDETVNRFCDFIFSYTDRCKLIPAKTRKKIEEFVRSKEVMPSMRLLYSAGPNVIRDNIAAYNCAALAVDSIDAWGEMMYILLAGTGGGYSVEHQYVDQLPVVNKQRNLPPLRFTVPDTRLGWKQAVDFAVKEFFAGRDVQFDMSQIRPAGSPLRTSGGYASGPEPLQRCLDFIRHTIIEAQGRQLSTLECSDIMNEIGASVVCGGVRRTAQICLCDFDDELMMNSKQGEFHPRRYMANISAVYRKKPNVLDYTQEFINSAKSGSGERGIFNLVAARKRSHSRRDKKQILLTNPCFRGDMDLLTPDGYRSFYELSQEKEVDIVNADGEVVKGRVWKSGNKEIIKIRFAGYHTDPIYCTPDHVFKLADGSEEQAQNLVDKRVMPMFSIKDDFEKELFLAGFVQGDGTTGRLNQEAHKGMEVYFGEKDGDIALLFGQNIGTWRSQYVYEIAQKYHLSSNPLPTRSLPRKEYMSPSFLSGLFSANGCVIDGYRVALKTTCFDLAMSLKVLLEDWFDIESYITTNKSKEVNFANGTYVCRESYDVNIGKFGSLLLFAQHISFGQRYKRDKLRALILKKAPLVTSVTPHGYADVYDFSEPKTNWGVVNGVVVHNCGETLLRNMGLCNLTEVIIRATDDFDTVMDKIKTATWLGCIQATLTYFPNLRSQWAKNAEEERLLGVSLTGLADNIELVTPETLRHWRRTAIKTAKIASQILGINMPAAVSVIKPSGTVSQLVNSSSGMHSRWSQFYIRRVRISKHDALFKTMINQGMPWVDDPGNHDTAVFAFPIKSPEGCKTRDQDTAIGQLEWYRMLVENWTEHNVSCTIYVREEEWLDVCQYVYKHFDSINGVAFFPYDNRKYPLPPYETIDEETYNRMVAELPEIDFSRLSEFEVSDTTEGARTFACSGNSCEI